MADKDKTPDVEVEIMDPDALSLLKRTLRMEQDLKGAIKQSRSSSSGGSGSGGGGGSGGGY